MTRLAYCCALSAVFALAVARTAVAQAPELDDFVLFGSATTGGPDASVRARGLNVVAGDIGTNGTLIGTKSIDALSSRIIGNRVDLDKASTCDTLLSNGGVDSPGCRRSGAAPIPVVADLATACGFPNPFPTQCSGDNIIVAHDGFAERPAGTYTTVDVAGGGRGPGTLVLTGGTYTFCSLRLGRNAQLLAAGPVTIRVIGSIKLDNGSQLRGSNSSVGPCEVQIFANTTGRVRISRKASVQAILCAPNAKLDVTVGANLRGAFYANRVKTDRVTLEIEPCGPTTTSTSTSTTSSSRPASSTTSTTTTSPTPTTTLCGNGVIDSGEQCDGSASGALCLPQECVGCTCPTVTTTSQPSTSSTSSSTSTTSSVPPTTTPGNCGNNVVDPGEDCDGSATPALCLPEQCVACSCPPEPTTSTSTTSTPTTSSTTTTTNCGNNVVDPGEECDGSANGAFCPPQECVGCTCQGSTTSTTAAPTTTSTTTTPSTTSSTSTTGIASTSSTSSSSSTSTTSTSSSSSLPPTIATTSSTSSSTSPSSSTSTSSSSSIAPTTSTTSTSTSTTVPTTQPPTDATGFDFLSTAGTGVCGNTFRDLAGTIPLKKLLCGQLSLGGGLSQVPDNATPPGATNRFKLTGCVGTTCNLAPTTAQEVPAGVDCTSIGCNFGTPLPISNAGLSVCVTNTFGHAQAMVAPSGTLDKANGAATWNFQLNSATILTGNPTTPCPTCRVAVDGAICVGSVASPCTGVCDGSPNQGAACTTRNGSGLTSACPSPAAVLGQQRCYRGSNNNAVCATGGDCPGGLCAQFIGNIPISLNPLTTGTSSLSNSTGLFCPGQTATQRGAFKSDICQTGANSGKPCNAATAVADCGAGVNCRAGTLTNYCNGGANDGLGCSTATTCPAPGACIRAGTLVQLVIETGSPAGALSVGVPAPIKLGTAFCVPATTNPTVNANANLPGPGGTSVVGTITLIN